MLSKRVAALTILVLGLSYSVASDSWSVSAQDSQPGDEFFVEKLYPILKNAQCHLCHADTGVAAATQLEFPRADATEPEITAFGLSLAALVDRDDPERSLLAQKPTRRIPHTGGERIPQDSDEEQILKTWIQRLSVLTDDELRAATEQNRVLARKLSQKPAVMRRLTHSQYNNTVRDLLGDMTRPANSFPPEDFVHGFKNQAHGQSIPPLLAEAYGQAAEKLAHNAFRGGDQNHLVPCEPTGPGDAACRDKFVRQFGLQAFRRPLTAEEAVTYTALFEKGAAAIDDFLAGAEMVVEAMVQSPNFLFRTEQGPGSRWYAYEVASRLSYFLWNTMPDAELLREARAGRLSSPADVEATAKRMLQDPKARPAMEEFLAQWMRFDRVRSAIRDRRLYRNFNSELASAMTEETSRLFHHLVWGDNDFREFFTARYGFLSSDLAALYGFPAPADEFARVDFPSDSGRAGVLGQAMFHTLTSKPAETSPTERGLFVREHFLCQKVPPPPPGVNSNLPAATDERPMNNRQRLQVHLTSEACSGCHRLVDPIGFGFEQYDAIGRFREKHHLIIYPTRDEQRKGRKKAATEYDLEIDTRAEVAGIADSEFTSPRELGEVLARSPECQQCLVKQVFRYGFGRPETAADRPTLNEAWKAFRDSGFHFRELILSLVTSKTFLEGVS